MHDIDPDRRRFASFDGVRGVAVILVMASHYTWFLQGNGLPLAINDIAMYGGLGVDLFFALSGFLITGILLSTRGHQKYFQSFYARRVLRIFPIYYLTLCFMFWVRSVFPPAAAAIPAPAEQPLYYLFLVNWIALWKGAWPPNALSHFWSLALEEQFYLVWPFVVLLFGDRRLKRVALAFVAISVIVRSSYLAMNGFSLGPMFTTFSRCDGLALGAFAAALYFEGVRVLPRTLVRFMAVSLIAFFGVTCIGGPFGIPYQAVGLTLATIAFAALLLYLADTDGEKNRFQRFFGNAALRTIGRYSYGMYVYHLPVSWLAVALIYRNLGPAQRASPLIGCTFIVGLSLTTYVLALLSYELLERRILALKRYFPAGPPITPAPAHAG